MDGLPVTVRLIDPPLHEFLPPLEELAVNVAVAQERGEDVGQGGGAARRGPPDARAEPDARACAAYASAWSSPACSRCRSGRSPRPRSACARGGGDAGPEIMVPLVGAVQELETVRAEAEKIIAEVVGDSGVEVLIGTMIEVPRAALTAGQIAEAAEFFSFGTNDLTQMGWGFSRDDVEGAFFWRYLELGIFGISPFESIDRDGVGRLVRIAAEEGRAARPGPEARRLRRARRRPRLGALLPRGRPGLRVLLAVPGAGGPAGGRPGRRRDRRVGQPLTHAGGGLVTRPPPALRSAGDARWVGTSGATAPAGSPSGYARPAGRARPVRRSRRCRRRDVQDRARAGGPPRGLLVQRLQILAADTVTRVSRACARPGRSPRSRRWCTRPTPGTHPAGRCRPPGGRARTGGGERGEMGGVGAGQVAGDEQAVGAREHRAGDLGSALAQPA